MKTAPYDPRGTPKTPREPKDDRPYYEDTVFRDSPLWDHFKSNLHSCIEDSKRYNASAWPSPVVISNPGSIS